MRMKKVLVVYAAVALLAALFAPGRLMGTVSNVTARNDYTADGTTRDFAYGFRILNKAELEVIDVDLAGVEVVKTVDTHYTVDGVGNAGGGFVHFTVALGPAPAVNHKIVILRKQPVQQTSDYNLNEGFPSERVEQDLDKQAMINQQQDEAIGRAVKLPKRSTTTNLNFPPAANCDSTNRFIAYNTALNALECATAPQGAQGPQGPPGSGGTGTNYQALQDEGVGVTGRGTINFIGAGVTCVDNAGQAKTDCTIPGASGEIGRAHV